MFRLKITAMPILTEIHSFRLDVTQDKMLYGTQNVVQENHSSKLYREQIEFITKICACYIGCVDKLQNMNCLLVSKLLHLSGKKKCL